MPTAPLKIAAVVGMFPDLTETFILHQLVALQEAGVEVDIIAFYASTDTTVHEEVRRCGLVDRVFCLNVPRNKHLRALKGFGLLLKWSLTQPVRLARVISAYSNRRFAVTFLPLFLLDYLARHERHYRILHGHFGPFGLAAVVEKICGHDSKVVTSFYGADLSSFVQRMGADAYDPLFAHGDLFIPLSEDFRDRLMALGCDDEKIVIQPLAIDLAHFSVSPRSTAAAKVRILSIGRLVEKKGLRYALQAVAQIATAHSQVEYTIVGEGPLAGELRDLAEELGLAGHVTFSNFVSQDKVSQLLAGSDIFLLPSVTTKDGETEGTPTVLIEAQAAGVPVLATRHAGNPEIVSDGNTGLLVPEADVDSLAAALERLVESPSLREQMGRQGRDWVTKRHDRRTAARNLISLYERLLANPPQRPSA